MKILAKYNNELVYIVAFVGNEKAVIAETKDQEIIDKSTGNKLFGGSAVVFSEVPISELMATGDEYLTSTYSQRRGTQIF